jgi:hypothetical protein
VLVADVSIDDADEIGPAAQKAGLETVFMATPNTAKDRLKRIADKTTGFIYTVSLLGTTGERSALSDLVKPLIANLKAITDKPVCVGFGISSAEHAALLPLPVQMASSSVPSSRSSKTTRQAGHYETAVHCLFARQGLHWNKANNSEYSNAADNSCRRRRIDSAPIRHCRLRFILLRKDRRLRPATLR